MVDKTRWNFEILDGPGSPGGNGRTPDHVGEYNAVSADSANVWYHDISTGALRHGWWDKTRWNFEILDGPGSPGGNGRTTDLVGTDIAAAIYGLQYEVWYSDITAGSLRHSWFDGTRWNFEILDGPGSPAGDGRTTDHVGTFNAATTYNFQLQDFYYDTTTASLRHGWWDGTRWNFETLDGGGSPGGGGRTTDNVGMYNAAEVYGTQLQVWYFDTAAGSLRHGWWDETRWNFEILDGPGSPPTNGRTTDEVGTFNAVAIYPFDQPQVWYHDNTAGVLRHGWWSGSTWYFQNLSA